MTCGAVTVSGQTSASQSENVSDDVMTSEDIRNPIRTDTPNDEVPLDIIESEPTEPLLPTPDTVPGTVATQSGDETLGVPTPSVRRSSRVKSTPVRYGY